MRIIFGIRCRFCGIRRPENGCPFQKAAQKYDSFGKKSIVAAFFRAKENFEAHHIRPVSQTFDSEWPSPYRLL
ncbi:MAG TPA: hypothetical protein DCF33_18345 [Saprospirales bacterium]|nr:hypothetical protein [Saprospirales bacterium]